MNVMSLIRKCGIKRIDLKIKSFQFIKIIVLIDLTQ